MSKGLHKGSIQKVDNPHQWMIDDARQKVIQQIRTEVERLENYYTSVEWYVEALLSFLDTLEEPKKDYNQLYKDIAKSDWFKKSYVDKSLGDVVPVEEPVCEDISREEQIALSIMAYLDTHIKNGKNLVLRDVTLQDAREWIRKQIRNEQPVCEELNDEIYKEKAKVARLFGGVTGEQDRALIEFARHFYKLDKQSKEEVSEDVEEAARVFVGFDMDRDGEIDYEIGLSAFIAGANWQKCKDSLRISETRKENEDSFTGEELDEADLDTMFEEYFDKYPDGLSLGECSEYFYKKGKKDMKEQMMKEAVEGEVESFSNMEFPEVSIPLNPAYFKPGDKVKLIIVKED